MLYITAYIRIIAVILIFTAFAEMIMPDGGIKQYICALMATLTAITLLQPVSGLIKGGDFERAFERYSGIMENAKEKGGWDK